MSILWKKKELSVILIALFAKTRLKKYYCGNSW